jgi:hypothetical protein
VKIKFICDEFFLCQLPEELYYYIEPIYGVRGYTEKVNYIIDGGIPLYKNGVIHFHNEDDVKRVKSITFNNSRIGIVTGLYGKYGLVQFSQMRVYLNNKEIRGISLFLAKFFPLIKIIPYQKEVFDFGLNSIQY